MTNIVFLTISLACFVNVLARNVHHNFPETKIQNNNNKSYKSKFLLSVQNFMESELAKGGKTLETHKIIKSNPLQTFDRLHLTDLLKISSIRKTSRVSHFLLVFMASVLP